MNNHETITITICDCAENHVGMQKIGNFSDVGFSLNDLLEARTWFNKKKVVTKLLDLNYPLSDLNIYPNDEGYVLIAYNAIDVILGPHYNSDHLFNEQIQLNWDEKAFMYGRVVKKHARHNLCYEDDDQEPNYELGKGRIVSYRKVPLLKKCIDMIPKIINTNGEKLVAEGNYYYDVKKCGIGFHGDSERKKVIGLRLGATMPLEYQWFQNSKSVGDRISLSLDHGDIYIMSEKATGNDWKQRKIYTLRHAAGSKKYLQIKK